MQRPTEEDQVVNNKFEEPLQGERPLHSGTYADTLFETPFVQHPFRINVGRLPAEFISKATLRKILLL
jgi:hypothetical protein